MAFSSYASAAGRADELTESETELREHITSLQGDVVAYRELAQQSIHALADRERQLQTRDRTIEHQREEIRTLRAEHARQMESARTAYRELRAEPRRSNVAHVHHLPSRVASQPEAVQ